MKNEEKQKEINPVTELLEQGNRRIFQESEMQDILVSVTDTLYNAADSKQKNEQKQRD